VGVNVGRRIRGHAKKERRARSTPGNWSGQFTNHWRPPKVARATPCIAIVVAADSDAERAWLR
jgi:hypothetical protein